ncbi:trichohyalin-like [Harmonia axyridis]|uniref:trichohyalin-like n=1 Tax=Harmonia axyridis TaxID=115357 RepID=UPI001E276120|nr:trichohyalin-like [Harmonia axyridis]
MVEKEIGSFLFLSGKSYSRLMRHLHRKEIEDENMVREKAYKEELKKISNEMAERWPDSIQNIKHREQERREMKEHILEEMRTKQMEYFKEFHRKEREQILHDIRQRMKMKRAPNSSLSNALVESHIRAENKANIKLKMEIKREEEENEARWAESVHEAVKEFKQNEEEKKCIAREKSKLLQAFQLKQIKDKMDSELQERQKRMKEEQEDLKKLEQEIKDRKNNEIEDFRNRKMSVKRYMSALSQRKEREKNSHLKEEAEMEEVCSIYNDFYTKRGCFILKQKKQEIEELREEKHKMGIANMQVEECKGIEENRIYLKQYGEEENKYQQKKAQEDDRKKKMIEERNSLYSDCMTKSQKRDEVTEEVKRFRLAERLKDMEEHRKYDVERRKQIRESEIDFTKEWDKQKILRKEYAPKNTPEKFVDFHGIEDERFFAYAKDVLDDVKRKGMEDYPIKREMNKYSKKNKLPMHLEDSLEKRNIAQPTPMNQVKLPKI